MFSYIFITIVINRNMTIFIVSEVRVKNSSRAESANSRQTDTMQYLGVQDKMSTAATFNSKYLIPRGTDVR